MKQKIEELESKLDQSAIENNNNNKLNSNFNINEDYDDEEWLQFFINEFKNRTAKGSSNYKYIILKKNKKKNISIYINIYSYFMVK